MLKLIKRHCLHITTATITAATAIITTTTETTTAAATATTSLGKGIEVKLSGTVARDFELDQNRLCACRSSKKCTSDISGTT